MTNLGAKSGTDDSVKNVDKPKKKPWYKKWWIWFLVAVVVVVIAVATAGAAGAFGPPFILEMEELVVEHAVVIL